MIVDARSVSNNKTIETDICIVGAGIAGITLAREFVGKDVRICLLESGGLEPDRVTQSLYWGENIGHHYFHLDTARAFGVGGSSHRWSVELGGDQLGVRLRPLDKIDFDERDWVQYSGWPFKKSHIDPFYLRAQSICQIGPFTYNVEDWEDTEKTPHLPFGNGHVKTVIFQFGPRDPFIKNYRDEIGKAENILTYIHANVLDIETNETATIVRRLRVATLQGNKFWVSAKLFILAAGGIDTPRILLLSNNVQKEGLGNKNDLVGRFFMEHIHLWSGAYIPSESNILCKTSLYKIHKVNGVAIMGKLALSEDVLRSEKLLNYCVSIHPRVKEDWEISEQSLPAGVSSLKKLYLSLKESKIPDNFNIHVKNIIADFDDVTMDVLRRVKRDHFGFLQKPKKIVIFSLNHMTEQAPNPDSRVTLAEERDGLGRNRVQLDWRFSAIDVRSIIRAQEIIDRELRSAGLGSLKIELKNETPPLEIHGGCHQMGTTRMHKDPLKGVVDENCRVHGISNLYIAGPSVFPTVGYANPVLTIVALSLRLADHLKKTMK